MIVAVDGSHFADTHTIGWAWVAEDGQWEADGMYLRSSNHRAELAAMLSAIEAFIHVHDLTIESDSASAIRIHQKLMWDYLANGWLDRYGRPVGEVDLIDALIDTAVQRSLDGLPPVKVTWVRAHSGIERNEWADFLARLGASTRIVSGTRVGSNPVDTSALPQSERYDHSSEWATLRRLARELGVTFSHARTVLGDFGFIDEGGQPSAMSLRRDVAHIASTHHRDTVMWRRQALGGIIESTKDRQ